jgi:mono/diheme cytochrome c family protein
MKKLVILIIGVAFFILPVVSACSAEKQSGQAANTKTLFEKKCSTCHGLDKPKSKQKTQPEWAETVLRMKNKNGAPVNDDEVKVIVEYLAKNFGK